MRGNYFKCLTGLEDLINRLNEMGLQLRDEKMGQWEVYEGDFLIV